MDKSTEYTEDLLEDKVKLSDKKTVETKEKQSFENDLKKLEGENRQLGLQLQGKMLEISRFQDLVGMLRAKLEQSKDYERLCSAIERNSQLETELQHLRNVDEKFKLSQTRNEQLEHEVNFYKTENTSFERKLKQMKTQAKQLNSDKQQLKRDKDELSIQKNQMELEFKTEIENINDELKTLKTIIQMKRGEIESLRIDLKSEETKNNGLKRDLERGKKEHSIEKNQMELEFKTEIENITDQLKTLKTIIQMKRDEIESLRIDLKSEEAKNNSLKGDLERERKEMELELKTEIENINDQLITYKTIIQIKRDEMESLRQTKLDEMESLCQNKRGEIESLRNDLKSKEYTINTLKGDLEGMQLRTTITYRQLEYFKQSLPSWIEKLEEFSEYSRHRTVVRAVTSAMFEIDYDLGKSLKFFDKTKNVKLSHYHDVIRELVETELSCSICTDALKDAVTLKCSHTFCEECLETWINHKMECPMCRAIFVDQYKTPSIDNVIGKLMACFPKESQTDQDGDHI